MRSRARSGHELLVAAAGEGCQSLAFLPSLLLCSRGSECRSCWFNASSCSGDGRCGHSRHHSVHGVCVHGWSNLQEPKRSWEWKVHWRENPLCCKAEICAPPCSLNHNEKRTWVLWRLELRPFAFGECGCSPSYCFWLSFELTSSAIARIVPLGFPCIIRASVDISQAGAHCRWNSTLISSLLFFRLRRIFLLIVPLFNGSCFCAQTCLCLLNLLHWALIFPGLEVGWSLAGILELEVESRILVDYWNLCCLAGCFSNFPKPEVQASDDLLSFL